MKPFIGTFAVLAALVMTSTSQASARGDEPMIQLGDHNFILLSSVDQPSIQAFVSYPGTQVCALEIRANDPFAQNESVEKIVGAIEVVEGMPELGGQMTQVQVTVNPFKGTIDLKPYSGQFGVMLTFKAKSGQSLASSIAAVAPNQSVAIIPIHCQ